MRIYEPRDLPANQAKPSYFVGLDLGQMQDYSALVVMEMHGTNKDDYKFHCRHLQRWQLRTPYTQIVADTVRLISSPQIQQGKRAVLAVDATGVGAPVIDLFKRERMNARLEPIQITGGATVSKENGMTRVPKRDLVSTVDVYLQNQRLKFGDFDLTETLIRELQNFRVKITDAANDTYGAWREGTHDDLVLAAALALWSATGTTPAQFYSFE